MWRSVWFSSCWLLTQDPVAALEPEPRDVETVGSVYISLSVVKRSGAAAFYRKPLYRRPRHTWNTGFEWI